MSNGFIHHFFSTLIKIGKRLNLVEYFKQVIQHIYLLRNPEKSDDYAYLRQARNLGIDLFIILKWLIIGIFWVVKGNNYLTIFIAWYLLITTVFTYFYYHAWNLSSDTPNTIARSQRRFLTVLLSMAFSVFCYAYFYGVIYFSHFDWGTHTSYLDMLYFSIANALTVTYGDVKLLDTTARILSASQLSITFIFVLIIASSIPTISLDKENKNVISK